jgi:hypothetical protein
VREGWDPELEGVVLLPSGRAVRGRGLRRTVAPGPPPQHGLYLASKAMDVMPWSSRWVDWPDFRLPRDRDDARAALVDAWCRSAEQRVEVACSGGRGRTGTALACLAVLDGVPADEAVRYIRDRYDRHAVETPGQRRYVATFETELAVG